MDIKRRDVKVIENHKEMDHKRFSFKVVKNHKDSIVKLISDMENTITLTISGPLWYNWSTTVEMENQLKILQDLKNDGKLVKFYTDQPLGYI